MLIILNEKKYALECLESGRIEKYPYESLQIIARYYYQQGCRTRRIMTILLDFLESNYADYYNRRSYWEGRVKKIARNAGKYPLLDVDGIWITKEESDTIRAINNKVNERVAFTFLCFAKYNNLRNPYNNGWVYQSAKDIFSSARVTGTVDDRFVRIAELGRLGLLEFPKRNGNLNNRVAFINNDSEGILFISDFRELGWQYLQYRGSHFIHCQKCGIIMKDSKSGGKKYCADCNAYQHKPDKIITCIDCGKKFPVPASNSKTLRCAECQKEVDKEKARLRKQKQRKSNLSR